MEKLVIASGNKGKIKEIKEILGGIFEVVPMSELGFDSDIEETGTTFFENALIKAKTVSLALNENVLADDSGLCNGHRARVQVDRHHQGRQGRFRG